MDMRISITSGDRIDKPLHIEVFGLSVTLSGLAPECPVIVEDSGDGLTVSIGAASDNEAVSQDSTQGAEPFAGEDAEQVVTERAVTYEPDGEQELFKKLSALRKKVAAETNVPPYVVFHDNTLREMCRKLPSDLTTLKSVQGVGQAKLDKYGELFIAAINEHTTGILEAA